MQSELVIRFVSAVGFRRPSDFAATTTCGASLAAGNNCTVTVTSAPSVIGPRNGTLTFTDNGTGSPQVVTLSATGVLAPPPGIVIEGMVAIGLVQQ
jgi:hypothetical protein